MSTLLKKESGGSSREQQQQLLASALAHIPAGSRYKGRSGAAGI